MMAQSVLTRNTGVKTELLSSATVHALMYSTVLMAALLKAVKTVCVGSSRATSQKKKSSMCSFQVTSRSANVYMMAVQMSQSSSEKHTHTHSLRPSCSYCIHMHRSTLAWERTVEEMSDGPSSCLGVMVRIVEACLMFFRQT